MNFNLRFILVKEGTSLRKGDQLKKNEWLASRNEKYILVMREDGGLVLSYNNQNRVLWESKTDGRSERLSMERNGNLVIYDNQKKVVWQTKTGERGDFAQVEDDGNLVVYDSNGFRLWSTGNLLSEYYFRLYKS